VSIDRTSELWRFHFICKIRVSFETQITRLPNKFTQYVKSIPTIYGAVRLVTANFVQFYNSLNFDRITYSSGRITLINNMNISTRAILKYSKLTKLLLGMDRENCAQGLIT
jgi:hypothetical protein